jgi:hypothetical protein
MENNNYNQNPEPDIDIQEESMPELTHKIIPKWKMLVPIAAALCIIITGMLFGHFALSKKNDIPEEDDVVEENEAIETTAPANSTAVPEVAVSVTFAPPDFDDSDEPATVAVNVNQGTVRKSASTGENAVVDFINIPTAANAHTSAIATAPVTTTAAFSETTANNPKFYRNSVITVKDKGFIFAFDSSNPNMLLLIAPDCGLGFNSGEIEGYIFDKFKISATNNIEFLDSTFVSNTRVTKTSFADAPGCSLWEKSKYAYNSGVVFPHAVKGGTVIATLEINGFGELHITGNLAIGYSGDCFEYKIDLKISNIFDENSAVVTQSPSTNNNAATDPPYTRGYGACREITADGNGFTFEINTDKPHMLLLRAPECGLGKPAVWENGKLVTKGVTGYIFENMKIEISAGMELLDDCFVSNIRATHLEFAEKPDTSLLRGDYEGAVAIPYEIKPDLIFATVEFVGEGQLRITGDLTVDYTHGINRVADGSCDERITYNIDVTISNIFG